MKKYPTLLLLALLTFVCFLTVEAKTVTEGTLDLEKIAKQISTDLEDYGQKKDDLIANIKSSQAGLQKLKEDYEKAGTEKDKITIKARTLRETSRLLDFYSQFYNLNINKGNRILPKLGKMKKSARQSRLGKVFRQLRDPKFKRNLKSLYVNLSSMTLMLNRSHLKKDVVSLLKENELLYRQGTKGLNAFDDISRNIEKVEDYLRSVYARTKIRARLLQQKKLQTELSIGLMKYVLALRLIQQAMLQVNPEGIMNIPEIHFEEFIDPIINEGQGEGGLEVSDYNDPDTDTTLVSFSDGPTFLK